jgi:cytidine deaminase
VARRIPWETLFAAALEARTHAHAPYSRFKVGSAVWADGRLYAGCNVENSSYGLSLCAERSAIAQAVARGARQLEAVVIVTSTEEPCPPCGACRQAMSEFGAPALPVRARTLAGKELRTSLGALLPHAFTKRFL